VEVISMTIDDLLEQALRLGNPFQTLRDLAARRLEEGETREQVLADFERMLSSIACGRA